MEKGGQVSEFPICWQLGYMWTGSSGSTAALFLEAWQEEPFHIRLLALVWAPSAYSKSSGCIRLGASGSQEGG